MLYQRLVSADCRHDWQLPGQIQQRAVWPGGRCVLYGRLPDVLQRDHRERDEALRRLARLPNRAAAAAVLKSFDLAYPRRPREQTLLTAILMLPQEPTSRQVAAWWQANRTVFSGSR